MEKRPRVSEETLELMGWTEAYCEHWADLLFGRFDPETLLEQARGLYGTKGHLSPWRVAKEEFAAMADKADYLPGGKYWRVLEAQ